MNNSHTIEQTLDSREVAEMVEKQHKDLMRDIKRYIKQMHQANSDCGGERNLAPTEFFRESTYQTAQNKQLPCYRITKKGCEFIAHKLTGTKGTAFTARYINRFHEMQQIISDQAAVQKKTEPERPWYIKKMDGKYVMLFRDFKSITGIELHGNYTYEKVPDRLIGGRDFNAWHEDCSDEKFCKEFKEKYGFDYGPTDFMAYLYPCGILKAFQLIQKDSSSKLLTKEASEILKQAVGYTMGITASKTQKKAVPVQSVPVIHIDIAVDKNMFTIC